MKNKIISAMLGACILVSLGACNLDREPKESVTLDNSLSTYNDAVAWHNGILAMLRRKQAGPNGDTPSIPTYHDDDYTIPQDVQADEMTATSAYGNNWGNNYLWVPLVASDQNTVRSYAYTYQALNSVNFVIEHFPSLIPTLSTSQQANVKIFLGEAYFARAYYYLELALRFGKSYTASTAASTPSVSLLLTYNPKQRPSRATNAEVYAQILKDLSQAETYLSGVAGVANARHITVDAVRALRARTALYMEDWSTALSAANAVINTGTYELMSPSVDNMTAMWRNEGENLKESILQLRATWPDENTATKMPYLYPNPDRHVFIPYYIPTQGIVDLYDAADTRKPVYFSNAYTLQFDGKEHTGLYMATKFWGNPSKASVKDSQWGVVPDSRMDFKVLRLAETYLIAAEAAYHSGGDALTPLNALRASRGLGAVASTGTALLADIRAERQRELFLEGFRLWDLRRWGLPMTRMTPQSTPSATPDIFLASGYDLTIPAGSDKFVWPIPHQDVQTAKLTQNPGY